MQLFKKILRGISAYLAYRKRIKAVPEIIKTIESIIYYRQSCMLQLLYAPNICHAIDRLMTDAKKEILIFVNLQNPGWLMADILAQFNLVEAITKNPEKNIKVAVLIDTKSEIGRLLSQKQIEHPSSNLSIMHQQLPVNCQHYPSFLVIDDHAIIVTNDNPTAYHFLNDPIMAKIYSQHFAEFKKSAFLPNEPRP